MRNRAALHLTIIILAVQAIAIIAFVALNHQFSSSAVDSQMRQILSNADRDAMASLDDYMADIERATTQVIAAASDAGSDPEVIEQQLSAALIYVPQLSGAYVAYGDGGFLFVRRSDQGYLTKWIDPAADNGPRTVTLIERDAAFAKRSVTLDPDDDYDPRLRPWYTAAAQAAPAPVWTDPYTFFSSQQPGITRAAQISMGRIAGVDVELSELTTLMARISSDSNGEAFIDLGDGQILSRFGLSPTDDLPDGFEATVQTTADSDESGVTQSYERNESTHLLHSTPIAFAEGRWRLNLDLAEDNVIAPVLAVFDNQRSLAIAIGASAVALMALLFVPATSPIRRLEADSTTDALTALPNRRDIMRRGTGLDDRSTGYDVVMIDVDHFKAVNDTYGHPVGDEVLREAAARLSHRHGDVGRLGGEEFLMIIDHESPNATLGLLERMRSDIAGRPFATSAGQIEITISLGLAHHDGKRPFSEVVTHADMALLQAKSQGRNRIVSYDPDLTVLGDEPATARKPTAA